MSWDDDKPLPEDEAIKAAHPLRSGRHDLYQEAMRLVGAKRSKGALVELVTWLLLQRAPTRDEMLVEGLKRMTPEERSRVGACAPGGFPHGTVVTVGTFPPPASAPIEGAQTSEGQVQTPPKLRDTDNASKAPAVRWETRALNAQGMCGAISGESPNQVACILPIDHVATPGCPAADSSSSADADRARAYLDGWRGGGGLVNLDMGAAARELAALLADVRRETIEACAALFDLDGKDYLPQCAIWIRELATPKGGAT